MIIAVVYEVPWVDWREENKIIPILNLWNALLRRVILIK
tara:strand:- start:1382 stop:1498 length:117 start_codon:yes stop_codon:yes gene_type:complete